MRFFVERLEIFPLPIACYWLKYFFNCFYAIYKFYYVHQFVYIYFFYAIFFMSIIFYEIL